MTRSAEQTETIETWRRMQRMLTPQLRLERGGFPVYRRTPLREIDPRDSQQVVHKMLIGYTEWFPDNWREGTGLMLVGDAGWGKTTLACALASELVHYGRPSGASEDAPGYVAAFITLDRYVREQQRSIRASRLLSGNDALSGEARQEIGEIMHSDWVYRKGAYLLVLDDVGREYRTGSGWAAQEFDSLLRERYDWGLPTVITSNLPLNKWDKEYSHSMRSFAEQACPVYHIG